MTMKVGIISDTHGKIHHRVFRYFNDVELILHAGDIGNDEIIPALEVMAPVKAITGNTDFHPLTAKYKAKEIFELSGKKIYLTHRVIEFGKFVPSVMDDIQIHDPDIVIFGHTHEQYAGEVEKRLFFNPGGAGQKRAGKRLAVGILEITNGNVDHSTFYLD